MNKQNKSIVIRSETIALGDIKFNLQAFLYYSLPLFYSDKVWDNSEFCNLLGLLQNICYPSKY